MFFEALIIFAFVLCIWYTMQEGEIFSIVGDLFSRRVPAKIHPAVFECNVCMTPWYGSALYWLVPWHLLALPEAELVRWPIVVFSAMAMQIVINKLETKELQETNAELKEITKQITIVAGLLHSIAKFLSDGRREKKSGKRKNGDA